MAKAEVDAQPPSAEAAPPRPEVTPPSTKEAAKSPATDLCEVAALSVVDEFQGQGGSYLLDPATGIRTLVERTKPAHL